MLNQKVILREIVKLRRKMILNLTLRQTQRHLERLKDFQKPTLMEILTKMAINWQILRMKVMVRERH